MRVCLVQQAKGNEPYMSVGIQKLSETNANKIWETRLRESEHRSKFVWVQKAKWWESVWSSRPRETNPVCLVVSRGWAKRTPIKFEKPGWGKVNTGQICLGPESWVMRVSLVEQAKGNEPCMSVGVQRLSETDAKKNWETWLRESEHRAKFVWVQKAEWWKSVWSSRPRETHPMCLLVSRGWAKLTPIKFEKPGWGKVNTGQNLFGARRLRVSLVEQAKGNKPYMYVGVQRLSEINPNKFWRNQAEGK